MLQAILLMWLHIHAIFDFTAFSADSFLLCPRGAQKNNSDTTPKLYSGFSQEGGGYATLKTY